MSTVDVHTHFYPPAFVDLLKSRDSVPYIRSFDGNATTRLIILPNEDDPSTPSTARGRPIGPEYWDIERKIAFMDKHGIDISVISLANPWLDFLPNVLARDREVAARTARRVNDDMNAQCAKHPGRLFAFGTLPLSSSEPAIVDEIHRLKTLPNMRGIIMGTSGLGKGLDDPAMLPIFDALAATETMVFLHPHYGLPKDVYGPAANDYGHVMPLALGFPLETTIAITRMILAQVFDRFEKLRLLLAHSGGTLPFLAGRIESCIAHDRSYQALAGVKRRTVWELLQNNIYLDAVIYGDVGLKAAVQASGVERLMFGTDHPFFPPLENEDEEWLSVKLNDRAVKDAFQDDSEAAAKVMGGNAISILNLRPT